MSLPLPTATSSSAFFEMVAALSEITRKTLTYLKKGKDFVRTFLKGRGPKQGSADDREEEVDLEAANLLVFTEHWSHCDARYAMQKPAGMKRTELQQHLLVAPQTVRHAKPILRSVLETVDEDLPLGA